MADGVAFVPAFHLVVSSAGSNRVVAAAADDFVVVADGVDDIVKTGGLTASREPPAAC